MTYPRGRRQPFPSKADPPARRINETVNIADKHRDGKRDHIDTHILVKVV